jgi:RNA 3'-phosphate cyclase
MNSFFLSNMVDSKINNLIELDGSYKEGGGSLVRVALALSTLTGKPFKVTKIRAGRKQSGLKAQHLTSIQALKEICGAKTNEIKLGSKELDYQPGKIKSGRYTFDIGTAGSLTLFLQALILPCLFAPAKVTIIVKGGTCGKWQASVDYLQNILLPHLARFVEKIELKILKRGYYPKGGGEVELGISPRFKLKYFSNFETFLEEFPLKTRNITLIEQGELEQIRGVVNVSSDLADKEVGERIKMTIMNSLKSFEVPINVRVEYAKSLNPGGEVVVWGVFSQQGKVDFDNPVMLAGDALVEKGKSSEDIGKEAANELKKEIESGAAADKFLTDMIIPFMGLLPDSEIFASEISNHTHTNIYVVEKFLNVGFKVEDRRVRVEKC